MFHFIFAILISFLLGSSFGYAEGFFWDTKNQKRLELEEFFQKLPPESLLLFGEKPAVSKGPERERSVNDHRRQGDLIRAYGLHLKDLNEGLDGGFEFIAYTEQFTIERYFRGNITLEKFLGEVSWPLQHPFDQYERQFYFPLYFRGFSYGVNAPKDVLQKISKSGLNSLTKEERVTLPEILPEGDENYFKRFQRKMRDYPNQEEIPYLFEALLASDETMAWSANKIFQSSKNRMVLLVDEFRVMFNQGLAERAKARSESRKIYTLIQRDKVTSDSKPLADFIWVNKH